MPKYQNFLEGGSTCELGNVVKEFLQKYHEYDLGLFA